MKFVMGALAGALMLSGAAMAQTASAPVKMGLLSDLSSAFVGFDGPGSVEALRMSIEDFGGSVLGQKVELISADHQNKADVAIALAREWFDSRGVDAIFDVANSGIALGMNTLAAEKKKLVLFTAPIIDSMTEANCNGYGFAWVYDTYSQVRPAVDYQTKKGLDTWFVMVPDYAAGHVMGDIAIETIKKNGGQILGSVRAPFMTPDYSSYILQAMNSKAKGLFTAMNGPDLINLMKQLDEFGVRKTMTVALNGIHDVDIKAIGADKFKDIVVATPWYWDLNDETRAFAKRFEAKIGNKPGWIHAGTYSAGLSYLKAVKAAGSKDTDKVREALFKIKIDDMFAKNATLRPNGRLVHDHYRVRLKGAAEAKYPWDYEEVQAVIPASEAYRPLSETKCPLVKKS